MNLGVFFFIVIASGKIMGYCIDKYVFQGAQDLPGEANRMALLKGESFGKALKKMSRGIYKTEEEISQEFDQAQVIKPAELAMSSFFGANRNYFIQVINEPREGDELLEE